MKPIRIRSEVEESRLAFRILLALAVASMGKAYCEWVEPSHPPFKGRLSWVWEIAFTLAGEVGIVLIWLGFGFSFVLMASFAWRRRPIIPSDPWWRGL